MVGSREMNPGAKKQLTKKNNMKKLSEKQLEKLDFWDRVRDLIKSDLADVHARFDALEKDIEETDDMAREVKAVDANRKQIEYLRDARAQIEAETKQIEDQMKNLSLRLRELVVKKRELSILLCNAIGKEYSHV